jgi:hypothetical protein
MDIQEPAHAISVDPIRMASSMEDCNKMIKEIDIEIQTAKNATLVDTDHLKALKQRRAFLYKAAGALFGV